MNNWMKPNEANLIGESFCDLAQVLLNQQGKFRFALNESVRSVIIECDVDGLGNGQGGINVYPSDGTSGPYWRRVKSGQGRIFALPSTKFINLIPFPNSQGFVHIQMVDVLLPPSVYAL